MNLAAPAPVVEAAKASIAPKAESAKAEAAAVAEEAAAEPAPKPEAVSSDRAPNVGPASAKRAPDPEKIKVDTAPRAETTESHPAPITEPATAQEAGRVAPATTVDDPMQHAPLSVKYKAPDKEHLMSVSAIRGTNGADFESRVAVVRGAKEKLFLQILLPWCFDVRDFVSFGEVLRYVLVKGDHIFVYFEETDTAPLFAIPFHDLRAIVEDRKKPDKYSVTMNPGANTNLSHEDLVTVLFKYKADGKQAYQFTFNTKNDKTVAERFLSAVDSCNPKRAHVTSSVAYAGELAKNKKNAQPEI